MADDFKLFYNFDPTDPPRFHKQTIDAAYFDWLFDMLADTGVTFLYRCNLAGRCYYPSQSMAPFDHDCVEASNDDAQYWHRVADMMDACDPFAEAVRAARERDIPIWAWWNWNEFQCVRRNYLYLIDPVWYEKPRKYWCSRDGSRFYHGIPDFGDADVQQRLLDLTRETLQYNVDGMYLSTRSHSWYACFDAPGWSDHLEPFGFNDSVVATYRDRHGIDIRYEDYDETLRLGILGEQFSNLLQQTGDLLHQTGKPFLVGISPDRHELCVDFTQYNRPAGPHLQLYKNWETWATTASIDGLCAEQSCPQELLLDAPALAPFRETLAETFPLYAWLDTAHFQDRGFGPFHLGNWNANTPQQLLDQITTAQQSGAAGAFLHSLYHYTACDTAGEPLGGYGVLPSTTHLDALRGLASK